GRRHTVLIGAAAFTASLLALAVTQHWLMVLSATAIMGFCSVLFLATANARLHLLTPDELRGRIMGIYTILLFGTAPLGGLLAGALANRLGVQETMALLAGLCALGVVVTLAYVQWRRDDLLPEPRDVPVLHRLEVLRDYLRVMWHLLHR
ncbi:MAG: MFS transporter, partial [Dehalococcoidia bacterium]